MTAILDFLLVYFLKLLDNFWLIISMLSLKVTIIGIFYFSQNTNRVSKAILWGIFYASLFFLTVLILFVVWLVFNFPK